MKASQQDVLATCIDIDLEKIKHAHQTTYFVPYRGAWLHPMHC